SIRGITTTDALADVARTGFRLLARPAAGAAVELVPVQVDASGSAPGEPGRALSANSIEAVRSADADVAARPTVAGIRIEGGACPVPFGTPHSPARNALPLGAVRRRPAADVSARSAVVGIGIQDGAGPIAADCPIEARVRQFPDNNLILFPDS